MGVTEDEEEVVGARVVMEVEGVTRYDGLIFAVWKEYELAHREDEDRLIKRIHPFNELLLIGYNITINTTCEAIE